MLTARTSQETVERPEKELRGGLDDLSMLPRDVNQDGWMNARFQTFMERTERTFKEAIEDIMDKQDKSKKS